MITQQHWTASGFANTDLDFLLKKYEINSVVIAGMRANTCIESTCRYAIELGYHVTLIKDAIGSFNWDEMKATIEINFPAFGHRVQTTQEFITELSL
ncbi:cysteine hydrolase family protein [Mariniflexile gromovii]|uniref:cysteine hydrolase family protein n=1 Tax=Mariniflexile gromovii TaxID=362523 RepID=UPI0021D47C88|nr:isochorismatase family protein [Mariniflexile gromovii]